jgi:hypothetical protein
LGAAERSSLASIVAPRVESGKKGIDDDEPMSA